MFDALKSRIRAYLPEKYRTPPPLIPVVRLTGMIGQGSNFRPGLTLATAAAPLEKAFKIKAAPAVALIVNSPGGSPVQSNLIFKRIRDLADEHEKRVFVFVEDVAASGGYYIAVAGDEIFADPSSVVGSIGVISGGFGFPQAIKKLGVERRIYTAGTNKSNLDPFQAEKKEDVAHLQILLGEIHETFVDVVKSRRESVLTEDDALLFNGRFWTGKTALGLGLIDGIGDLRGVLRARYGDKVKLKVMNAGKGRGLRRFFGGSLPEERAAEQMRGLGDGLATALEERGLWQRFGL